MTYSLTGNKISQTYQKLVQIVNGLYYDGLGNRLDFGPTGFQGSTGFQGVLGNTGPQGFQGLVGQTGFQGPVASHGIKQYVAVLNQSGTDDPVATVLVNTLGGDVVWTRSGLGGYLGNLTGAFTVGKTTSLTPFILNGGDGLIITMESTVNSFQILTYFWSLSEFVAPTPSDSILNNTIINITVYP